MSTAEQLLEQAWADHIKRHVVKPREIQISPEFALALDAAEPEVTVSVLGHHYFRGYHLRQVNMHGMSVVTKA